MVGTMRLPSTGPYILCERQAVDPLGEVLQLSVVPVLLFLLLLQLSQQEWSAEQQQGGEVVEQGIRETRGHSESRDKSQTYPSDFRLLYDSTYWWLTISDRRLLRRGLESHMQPGNPLFHPSSFLSGRLCSHEMLLLTMDVCAAMLLLFTVKTVSY